VSLAKPACDYCCRSPGPPQTAADGSREGRAASAFGKSHRVSLLSLPRLLPPPPLKGVQLLTLGSLANLCGKTSGYCKGNGMLSLFNTCYRLGFVKMNSSAFVAIGRTAFHPSSNCAVFSGTLFYIPANLILFSCYFFSEVTFSCADTVTVI